MSGSKVSESSDFRMIMTAMEQRLDLFRSILEQKLKDVIQNKQVNQVLEMGIDSIMHSVWMQLCSQRLSVSVSCQTEEQLRQDCDTVPRLPKSSTHPYENHPVLHEEEVFFLFCGEQNSQSVSKGMHSVAEQAGVEVIKLTKPTTGSSLTDADKPSTSNVTNAPPTKRSKLVNKPRSQNVYPCRICKAKLPRKDMLLAHERIHDEIKCRVCSRVFTKFSHLKMHTRVHTGKYPHECDKCGKSFASSADLFNHNKYHEEPPHRCTLCGKGFHRKAGLVYHMGTHDVTKPFPCELCGKAYRSQYSLTNHIEAQHAK